MTTMLIWMGVCSKELPSCFPPECPIERISHVRDGPRSLVEIHFHHRMDLGSKNGMIRAENLHPAKPLDYLHQYLLGSGFLIPMPETED